VVARGDDVDITVLGDQALGGEPKRGDSLFRIASVGKLVTAVALLRLVSDGAFALDDPVDDLLPELAGLGVLSAARPGRARRTEREPRAGVFLASSADGPRAQLPSRARAPSEMYQMYLI
jgi:CubicO group peptidase (beta-lactamase class C family)